MIRTMTMGSKGSPVMAYWMKRMPPRRLYTPINAVAPKVSQRSKPQVDMVWRTTVPKHVPAQSAPRSQAAMMVPATPTAAASATAAMPA